MTTSPFPSSLHLSAAWSRLDREIKAAAEGRPHTAIVAAHAVKEHLERFMRELRAKEKPEIVRIVEEGIGHMTGQSRRTAAATHERMRKP